MYLVWRAGAGEPGAAHVLITAAVALLQNMPHKQMPPLQQIAWTIPSCRSSFSQCYLIGRDSACP